MKYMLFFTILCLNCSVCFGQFEKSNLISSDQNFKEIFFLDSNLTDDLISVEFTIFFIRKGWALRRLDSTYKSAGNIYALNDTFILIINQINDTSIAVYENARIERRIKYLLNHLAPKYQSYIKIDPSHLIATKDEPYLVFFHRINK